MIRSKQTTTENLEADIEALQLQNCCIIQVIDCPISVTMIGTDIWRAFGYALKTGSQHE